MLSCDPVLQLTDSAAVLGISQGMADFLGPFGIRVNCVSPAVVASALQTEERRVGAPRRNPLDYFNHLAILFGRDGRVVHLSPSTIGSARSRRRYRVFVEELDDE